MESTVSSVASKAVLDACAALGLDRAALAARAGVSLEQLSDPDARIPAAAADAVWAAAVATSGDPCLAIHAAAALPFGAYRVIDFLTAHAPTLGDALTRVAAYFPLVDPRGAMTVTAHDGRVEFGFKLCSGLPVPRPAAEYTFTALVSRSRAGIGFDWRPLAVELIGPPGPEANSVALTRALGAPPRYDCSADRFYISAEDWARPNAAGDRGLFEVLERHAAMLLDALPAPSSSFAVQVREVISAELRSGQPTLERVGKRLGVSGRTLQRRLDEHDLRFGTCVDEVKAALAKAYLHDRALGLSEIAFLLGFADQSAFTRAFKRWSGQTPGRYRREHA